ncbi:tetratricopeptide repeat protein [Streptomyces sp. NPDC029216]|uniref:tetratricopeptide repeat protein n=1 Tax=Streptomyces sp. NPDC029216 TaxID=3154701 RepID=UPI0033E4F173
MAFFRSRGRREDIQRADDLLAQARALYTAGRYAEAEAEARSVAAAQGRNPDDLAVPMALSIAALAASAQGHHAEALATYDAQLPVVSEVWGDEHRLTLKLRLGRAEVLNQLGRHTESEEECVAVCRAAARADMPYVVKDALIGQIRALDMLGAHPAVEAVARNVLAAHDGQDRFTVRVRFALAHSLNAQGRYEEALAENKRADVLDRAFPREDRAPETGMAELNEATAFFGLGRNAQARPLAASAHRDCLAFYGPDHPRTLQARSLLDRIDGA